MFAREKVRSLLRFLFLELKYLTIVQAAAHNVLSVLCNFLGSDNPKVQAAIAF